MSRSFDFSIQYNSFDFIEYLKIFNAITLFKLQSYEKHKEINQGIASDHLGAFEKKN